MEFEQFKIITDQPGKNKFYDDFKAVTSFGTEKIQDEGTDNRTSDQDMTSPTSTFTMETNWQSSFKGNMNTNIYFRKYNIAKYLSQETKGTFSPSEQETQKAAVKGSSCHDNTTSCCVGMETALGYGKGEDR